MLTVCGPCATTTPRRYTWWWCAAHVVFYFVYMDYMSFATHYHILHGNNWCWLNLHKQHHQIKSPTAFAGVRGVQPPRTPAVHNT